MTPFYRTSKADFCVLKIPCVLKIFSKPRLKSVLRPQHRSRVRTESIFRGRSKPAPERLERTLKIYPIHVTFRVEQFPLYTRWLLYDWKSSQDDRSSLLSGPVERGKGFEWYGRGFGFHKIPTAKFCVIPRFFSSLVACHVLWPSDVLHTLLFVVPQALYRSKVVPDSLNYLTKFSTRILRA